MRAGSAGVVGVGSFAGDASTVVVGVASLALGADEPVVELEAVRPQEVAVISVGNVVVAGLTLRRRTLANSGCGVEDRLLADFQAT